MTIGRILNEKLLVGIVNEIKCSICKNIYFPDDSDISLSPLRDAFIKDELKW